MLQHYPKPRLYMGILIQIQIGCVYKEANCILHFDRMHGN